MHVTLLSLHAGSENALKRSAMLNVGLLMHVQGAEKCRHKILPPTIATIKHDRN